MKGLAKHTERIIEPGALPDYLKGRFPQEERLLLFNYKLNEDSDFMRWQNRKGERMDVDCPTFAGNWNLSEKDSR